MTKYTQTQEDLQNYLCEQLQFLRASSASFDNGFEGEDKRLATTIRVLVHDTKSSNSLLNQLNMKHIIRMHNTAHPFIAGNLAPHQGLVIMRMDVPEGASASLTFTLLGERVADTDAPPDKPRSKVTYVARAAGPDNTMEPIMVSFSRWWDEVVIADMSRQRFNRKELVLAMTNKEGGAHVDSKLDEKYARLTRFHSQGWQVITKEIRQPLDNSIVEASVRQIAHELLVSIEQAFPDVCTQQV